MLDSKLLRGSLRGLTIEHLLLDISASGRDGVLLLQSQGSIAEAAAYFEEGWLLAAIELGQHRLQVTDILQQKGLLSQDQIQALHPTQIVGLVRKQSSQMILEERLVSDPQFKQALQTQFCWTIGQWMNWSKGSFRFQLGERLPADEPSHRLRLSECFTEAREYSRVWQSVQPYLPNGAHTVVTVVDGSPPDPAMITAEEWPVILAANGFDSIRLMANRLQQSEIQLTGLVVSLMSKGVLINTKLASLPLGPVKTDSLTFYSLLTAIEQTWLHAQKPTEQVLALAQAVNSTLTMLAGAYNQGGEELPEMLLADLLNREKLGQVGSYSLPIRGNRLELDALRRHLRFSKREVGQQAQGVLRDVLRLLFCSMSMAMSSPLDRAQSEAAWNALLTLIAQEGSARD